MTRVKKDIGDLGESVAVEFLKKNKFVIIDTKVITPYGEVDIVAVENNRTCFIEVKTRSSLEYGRPMDAITPYKIRNIAKSAEFYMHRNKHLPVATRIDVVEVYMQEPVVVKLFRKVDM